MILEKGSDEIVYHFFQNLMKLSSFLSESPPYFSMMKLESSSFWRFPLPLYMGLVPYWHLNFISIWNFESIFQSSHCHLIIKLSGLVFGSSPSVFLLILQWLKYFSKNFYGHCSFAVINELTLIVDKKLFVLWQLDVFSVCCLLKTLLFLCVH